MNKKLRAYLESKGLNKSASDADAQRYMAGLTGPEAEEAKRLASMTQEAATVAQNLANSAEADSPSDTPAEDSSAANRAPKPQASAAPSVQPTSATSHASAVDPEQLRREGAKAERDRQTGIREMATRLGLPEVWANRQIESNASVEQARNAVLDTMMATHAPVHLQVVADNNRDTLADGLADAVLMRSNMKLFSLDAQGNIERDSSGNVKTRQPHGRARAFQGQRLVNMARSFLVALGQSVEGLTDAQVAKMAFNPRVTMLHSTSDFSNILANAMNKTLRAEYQEYPQLWSKFCSRNTAPDFKEIKRTQLGEVPNLLVVNEGGEYAECTIGDKKEVYSLVKYGRSFSHTWEMMINDDLGAFVRTPRMMYRAAVRLEDVTAFGVLTANANMSDGTALFHADHGNLQSGGGLTASPSTITLNAMLKLFRAQTGLSDDVLLNLTPKFIIVPAALEGSTSELLNSAVKPGANNGTINIWNGRLELIVHPLLDANSATVWYAAADPADIDTIEVCFLEGYEQPTIEQSDSMNPDKRVYNVRHVVAAKAIDWRGLYKNPGA